jgi:hypothetical protein
MRMTMAATFIAKKRKDNSFFTIHKMYLNDNTIPSLQRNWPSIEKSP